MRMPDTQYSSSKPPELIRFICVQLASLMKMNGKLSFITIIFTSFKFLVLSYQGPLEKNIIILFKVFFKKSLALNTRGAEAIKVDIEIRTDKLRAALNLRGQSVSKAIVVSLSSGNRYNLIGLMNEQQKGKCRPSVFNPR